MRDYLWNWLLTCLALLPAYVVARLAGLSGWWAFAVVMAAGFANFFGFLEVKSGWRR